MQTTENYGFIKPDGSENYNVEQINENFDIIDKELKTIAEKAESSQSHSNDMENPHDVTAKQVGLGNVPNVATNDQTPTYIVAAKDAELSSGEKLSVAFGKIAKAIKSLISHFADTVSHVTLKERTEWNSKAAGTHSHTKSEITDFPSSMPASDVYDWAKASTKPEYTASEVGASATGHKHTKSEITDFPSTMPPSAHNQAASTITDGTLGGRVVANATAVATLGDKQLRNISAGTVEMVAGTSELTAGDIYVQLKV